MDARDVHEHAAWHFRMPWQTLVIPDSLASDLETTFSGGSRRLLQTMKIASLQWRVGGSECRTPPRREGITLVFYETAAMLQMQQFRLVFAVVVLLPIRPAQLPATARRHKWTRGSRDQRCGIKQWICQDTNSSVLKFLNHTTCFPNSPPCSDVLPSPGPIHIFPSSKQSRLRSESSR